MFSLSDGDFSLVVSCFSVPSLEGGDGEEGAELVLVLDPSLDGFCVGVCVACGLECSAGPFGWPRRFPQSGHFSSFGSTLAWHFEHTIRRFLAKRRNARRAPMSAVMRPPAISQ